MKKLEDLPKRADYKVPDGYFDQLPLRIQGRLSAPRRQEWKLGVGWVARYSIPLVILLTAGIYWYQQANSSLSDKLERINAEQLSFFVEDTDLTSEELVDNVTWTTADLDALELEVYSVLDAPVEELDLIIDELELENI
jgi:hypothetical protein